VTIIARLARVQQPTARLASKTATFLCFQSPSACLAVTMASQASTFSARRAKLHAPPVLQLSTHVSHAQSDFY
jgi:hypothetical protein